MYDSGGEFMFGTENGIYFAMIIKVDKRAMTMS
jgi:hypothetical protein